MHRKLIMKNIFNRNLAAISIFIFCFTSTVTCQPRFKVLAFGPPTPDPAHECFIHEANRWFATIAGKYNFIYDSTNTWADCDSTDLSRYQVVMFLDNRPEDLSQRKAFQQYMEHGGAWMGFHFAAFAMDSSAEPQNWDWYHLTFLGSGQYVSNTWAPTPANLKVEDTTCPATLHLPTLFTSAPNEWYRWSMDLRSNPNIKILLSIDPSSFPLGTGTGAGGAKEIWTSGYYPVAWTNKNYKMIYVNMGHDVIDYKNNNRQLSSTFASAFQDQFIINGILWLGRESDSSGASQQK